jgi:hypothetical protein
MALGEGAASRVLRCRYVIAPVRACLPIADRSSFPALRGNRAAVWGDSHRGILMFARGPTTEARAIPSVQPVDPTIADVKCTASESQAQAVEQLDIAEQELQTIKRVLKSLPEKLAADDP